MRPPFAAIRDLCREITAAVRLARREPWTGAVTFVPAVRRRPQPQRALSLRDPGRHLRPRRGSTRFVALPGRLDDEIQEVLRRIVRRMHRLLRPDHERAQTDAGAPDALAAAQAHSVNLIWVSSRDPLRTKKQAAYLEGFSLHAGVHLQSASAVGFSFTPTTGGSSSRCRPCSSRRRRGSSPPIQSAFSACRWCEMAAHTESGTALPVPIAPRASIS